MSELEQAKWYLSELANADGDDIECNDLEIYAEDENGCDGAFTEQITNIADMALKQIKKLQELLAQKDKEIERNAVIMNEQAINRAIEIGDLKARNEKLEREIKVLRHYGYKDSIAMADEALNQLNEANND